jgi:hypothetical protein
VGPFEILADWRRWKPAVSNGIFPRMAETAKVVAWKFLAELNDPDGLPVIRACYVELADRTAAAQALAAEHRGANFRVDRGEPLTEEGLHAELRDTFLHDEVVRCVNPS